LQAFTEIHAKVKGRVVPLL